MPPFVHRIRVRYNECDQQDAVFNGNYLVYIDVSWTELYRDAFGGYENMVKDGYDVVVAEANIQYKRPARFDDLLDVAVTIENLGTTSIATRFDITRDGEEIAIGRLRYVFIEVGGGKTPITDAIREGLSQYLA